MRMIAGSIIFLASVVLYAGSIVAMSQLASARIRHQGDAPADPLRLQGNVFEFPQLMIYVLALLGAILLVWGFFADGKKQ